MDNPLFGICPVCSSDGGDLARSSLTGADAGYAETTDAGSGDDVRNAGNDYKVDTTQDGVPLVMYNGKVMCNTCKDRLMSDEESRISAVRHAEGEKFRAKAGFVKTIT